MPRLPRPLRPLYDLVRDLVPSCALTVSPRLFPSVTPKGRALAGQCDNAAALFKHLAGDSEGGWRTMNLSAEAWPYGSHWFLLHAPTGLVVDPTADQFPRGVRVPYERARGRTSGGVRYALDAKGRRVRLAGRKAVRDLLDGLSAADRRRVKKAAAEAARWSLENSAKSGR